MAELTPPTFPCEPPTDVTANLIVPTPQDCVEIIFSGYSSQEKIVAASFVDCNGDSYIVEVRKIDPGVETLFINGVDSGPWPDAGPYPTYCVDLLQPYSNENFQLTIGDPC